MMAKCSKRGWEGNLREGKRSPYGSDSPTTHRDKVRLLPVASVKVSTFEGFQSAILKLLDTTLVPAKSLSCRNQNSSIAATKVVN